MEKKKKKRHISILYISNLHENDRESKKSALIEHKAHFKNRDKIKQIKT